MTQDRVRWGILGTAHIAERRILPAIARSETATVAAVASRDEDRARDFAARHGIPRAFGSYGALLDDDGIEAIYNPLPNSLHRPWTQRAAEAGKHVLCEKPLAVTAAEADAMVAACRAGGVLLMEGFMYRFHPQIDTVRRLVDAGAVGTLRVIRSAFTFTVTREDDIRLDAGLGGGGLMDVGCYCVNVSRLLLGEPGRVFASAIYDRGVDVALSAMLAFAGGAVSQFDCGLRAPYRQFCELVGTEGTITLGRPFQPEEDPARITLRRGRDEEQIDVPATNQYMLMIDHFGACLRAGAPPRFPAQDAVANMRVIDAVRESAQSGQPVLRSPAGESG